MLESLKDSETGKIKKPILISLIGGGALLMYMLFKGKGGSSGVVSTGQTTPLTPDLTGLADALKTLNDSRGSVGGSGSGGSTIPASGSGGASYTQPTTYFDDQPVLQPGSSGAGGGGGGGTGQVIQPIAKAPSVYGGYTSPVIPIPLPQTTYDTLTTAQKAAVASFSTPMRKPSGTNVISVGGPTPKAISTVTPFSTPMRKPSGTSVTTIYPVKTQPTPVPLAKTSQVAY